MVSKRRIIDTGIFDIYYYTSSSSSHLRIGGGGGGGGKAAPPNLYFGVRMRSVHISQHCERHTDTEVL